MNVLKFSLYCFKKFPKLLCLILLQIELCWWLLLLHRILVDKKFNFARHLRDVCTNVRNDIGVCKKLDSIMALAVLRKMFSTPSINFDVLHWNVAHSSVIQLKRLESKMKKKCKNIWRETWTKRKLYQIVSITHCLSVI